MIRFPHLPFLLLALIFAACVPFSRDCSVLRIPADWKNAGNFPVAEPSRDLSRWWRHFDDPVLSNLIATAIKHNPDLEAAAGRVREVRAQRDAERASLFPTLDANAGSTTRRFTGDSSQLGGTNYSANLNAAWEIDLFGKRRSSILAASSNLDAAQENLHSVQASLAAEVATAYTNLRANEARLTVLQQNISSREETAKLAGWRQQSGEADALESSQAHSSLESARASIPALHQAIDQAKNQLALLAGFAPGSLDAMLSRRKGNIPQPPKRLAVGIPADVLRQRPDVRQAGYQVLAAAANTHAVEATRYPSLNLSGSLGLDSVHMDRMFNPEAASASLLAGITSPIFNAGRIRANIAAASAAEDQARANYRRMVLTALSDTEDALIACRRSAERLVSLEKATQLARDADQLARQRYQAGEIDFLAVLDTQRTVLTLEDSLLTTRTDRTTAYIRLYQALGGGY